VFRVLTKDGRTLHVQDETHPIRDADGKLLYDTRFYSSYRGEVRLIRVGTKPNPAQTETTTTGTTTTTTTTTTKTTTTPRP